MEGTNMINENAELMTWSQIRERYPRQWVGLTDVEMKATNSSTVSMARPTYTGMKKTELYALSKKIGKPIFVKHTDPDSLFQVGAFA